MDYLRIGIFQNIGCQFIWYLVNYHQRFPVFSYFRKHIGKHLNTLFLTRIISGRIFTQKSVCFFDKRNMTEFTCIFVFFTYCLRKIYQNKSHNKRFLCTAADIFEFKNDLMVKKFNKVNRCLCIEQKSFSAACQSEKTCIDRTDIVIFKTFIKSLFIYYFFAVCDQIGYSRKCLSCTVKRVFILVIPVCINIPAFFFITLVYCLFDYLRNSCFHIKCRLYAGTKHINS